MQELSRRLTEPFSAYNRAVVPEVDHELAEVGPGTPGGEYLRRFWHPVAHADQLGDLPVAVRILGEDLVVFRDKSAAVGLLERHCGHRGTSLEYGKIEDHGIRCCYHGWLFDVDGKVLEAPAEPESNPYEGKLYQGAYPVQEYNGLLFAYMGPPALRPPFPMFDIYDQPGMALGHGEADLRGNIKPCNWLQVMIMSSTRYTNRFCTHATAASNSSTIMAARLPSCWSSASPTGSKHRSASYATNRAALLIRFGFGRWNTFAPI